MPETVYRASRHYAKLKQTMPMAYIKLYMYQLLRSLAYIHSVGSACLLSSRARICPRP